MSNDTGAELVFVDPEPQAYAEAAAGLAARGRRVFRVCGPGANEVAAVLAARLPDADVAAAGVPATGPDAAVVLAGLDDAALGEALHARIDDLQTAVIAPVGSGHSSRRPLYLISIPKAGTHLLFALARAFGYAEAVATTGAPLGGNWYCVADTNTHTTARRFLVDEVARSPLGARDHPFLTSPALFVYRDPRDILCSEADWFHKPANSPLAGYLAGRERDERIAMFLRDEWILGTIRDRVGAFVPWLSFPNVLPVSYEELVGAKGGGDDSARDALIWSLQLKLQVAGRPADHAAKLYDTDSPTFSRGQIGAWRTRLSPEQLAEFEKLPQDFMDAFGYPAPPPGVLPRRAAEFRGRKLALPAIDYSSTPVGVLFDFWGANIVRFRNQYFAISQSHGPIDLAALSEAELARFVRAPTLEKAKAAWIADGATDPSARGADSPMRLLEYRARAAEERAAELSAENAGLRDELARVRAETVEVERRLLLEAARAVRSEAEAEALRNARVLRIARRLGRMLGRG